MEDKEFKNIEESLSKEDLKSYIEGVKRSLYDIRTNSFKYDWCEIVDNLGFLYNASDLIQDIEVYKEFLLAMPELSKILISEYGIDYDYEEWKNGYDDGEWTFHAPAILKGEFPLEELPMIMRDMAKEMYYTKSKNSNKSERD